MKNYTVLDLGDGATVKVHPAADLFPMMQEPELDELAANIARDGLQAPVVLITSAHGPLVIDGRNRLRAIARIADPKRRHDLLNAFRLGKNGTIQVLTGGTINEVDYVISANLHRRHLNAEQKREIIAESLRRDPERSDRAIAEKVRVDHKTVAKVRREGEQRGEIPHVTNRNDTKGRQQPVRKSASVKSAPSRESDDRPVNGSKNVTDGNPNKTHSKEAPADPVETLLASVKAALTDFTIEQQKRAGPELESIGRNLRLYAGLAPEVVARRKANAAKKAASVAKKRVSITDGDKTDTASLAAQGGEAHIA